MNSGVKPADSLAGEKIALLRTFLYLDGGLYISQTVREEYKKIIDDNGKEVDDQRRQKYERHERTDYALLKDIPQCAPFLVEERTQFYNKMHSGYKDCKILAEAELGGCGILLTYDCKFWRHLYDKVQNIRIMKPSEFWQEQNLQKGVSPVLKPDLTNPLANEKWWIW